MNLYTSLGSALRARTRRRTIVLSPEKGTTNKDYFLRRQGLLSLETRTTFSGDKDFYLRSRKLASYICGSSSAVSVDKDKCPAWTGEHIIKRGTLPTRPEHFRICQPSRPDILAALNNAYSIHIRVGCAIQIWQVAIFQIQQSFNLGRILLGIG